MATDSLKLYPLIHLGRLLQASIVAVIVLEPFVAGLAIRDRASFLRDPYAPDPTGELQSAGLGWLEFLGSYGSSIAWLCAVLFTLLFLFRAMRNLKKLGSPQAKMSPGWVVGWWFLPISSLIKPYQGVRQIWKGSREEAGEQISSVPKFILFWWGFWVAGTIIGYAMLFLLLNELIAALEWLYYLSIAASPLMMISGFLYLRIIRQITQDQETMLGKQATPNPSPQMFTEDETSA